MPHKQYPSQLLQQGCLSGLRAPNWLQQTRRGDVMGRQPRSIAYIGLLLLLQHGLHVQAAATRSYLHTFPSAPPAAITVQPPTGPRPNVQDKAAPTPMGRNSPPPMVLQPQPVAAKSPGSQNMRLAAPAAAAAATPAAAPIPFAFSVPYNPNSQYKRLPTPTQQQGQVGSSGIPESHPVGLLAPLAVIPSDGRPKGVAGLISSGAQAVSALTKMLRRQNGADSSDTADVASEEPVAAKSYSSSSSSSSNSRLAAPVPQQARQGSVGIASVVSANPRPTVYFPSGAVPLSNIQQQQQQYGRAGTVQPAAVQYGQVVPAVRAVDKPGFKGSLAAAAAAGVAAVAAGSARPAVAATQLQPVMQPVIQPLAPGLMRMATNNMGAPMAGPLGGPTYMPKQPTVSIAAMPAAPPATAAGGAKVATAAAGAASASKVSVASIGTFNSAAAPPAVGMESLQQHFAAGKPPMYAPLPSTMHVAPPKGSKSKAIIAGPSIDDLSAATGAPVAQLSWQLPKKVHIGWAPAADLLRAAPVSPFEMPSSMKEDGGQVSKGAVSHHLTPTWVPAA